MKQLDDSTKLLGNANLLLKKAEEDGYLYFKGLIKRENIFDLRIIILSLLNQNGWLDEQYPIDDGIVKKGVEIMESPKESWVEFYKKIICLRDFSALAFDENILKVVNILIDGTVLPHCRKVLRAYSPSSSKYATPPHRDYTWTGGTPNFWAAWIPLGDLDSTLGGVELVAGSTKMNLTAIGNDERKGWILPDDLVWSKADSYEMGDVLFFHSWTLHAGRNNHSINKVRLSADFRYQNVNQPIRADSMCCHWNEKFNISWDNLYKDWPIDDPLKFYWEQFSNVVEATQGSFHQDVNRRFILHKIMSGFEKKD